MFRTTFVAVTGSLGKTTATRCLHAILSSCYSTSWAHGHNSRFAMASAILRTRLRHRFTLIEVGTTLPGALRRTAWTLAPDTAVVLAVARVHSNNFATLDDIAHEKSQLLSRLGLRGIAVLNGDDPLVAAMAARCRGPVVMFGRSPEFYVWASDVSSVWPARLSFRVHRGAESRAVRTQMVGEHWLSAVLAAFAAALWQGVDLDTAVAAVERLAPTPGRLEPMPLPSGAMALRDEYNYSLASLTPALRVLEQARVPGRRILVTPRMVDTGRGFRESFRSLGELAVRSVELVIVIGNEHRRAFHAMVEGGMRPENIRGFKDIWGAAECLKSETRAGDLVLFRNCPTLRAERIYFSQLGSVGCRTPVCPLLNPCDYCPELRPGLENVLVMPAPPRPFWLATTRTGGPQSVVGPSPGAGPVPPRQHRAESGHDEEQERTGAAGPQ
ncbi:MAG: Mur ligase family protein [Bryobacteraceae bacterium]